MKDTLKYTYSNLDKSLSSFSMTPLLLSPRDKPAASQTLPAKLNVKKYFESDFLFRIYLFLQICNGYNQELKY